MWRIKGAVGKGGINSPVDVKTIQALINVYQRQTDREPLGQIDGKSDDSLIGLINEFQKTYLRTSRPDGRVDPNGRSWRALHDVLRKSHQDGLAPVKPKKGIVTFESEGTEGGRFHSRILHVPSRWSGVTIGRGYDMKGKSQAQIQKDLTKAGIPGTEGKLLAKASGLKGEAGRVYILENDLLDFSITPKAQKELFLISYAEEEKEAKRVATSSRLKEEYGEVDWDALDGRIRQIVVDLKFRGDYHPQTQPHIQPHIAKNDLVAFTKAMKDRTFWKAVPKDRFDRRVMFLGPSR